ncbi:hypothetical protein FNV43_RR12131 [Rhamnella rubrinervis]|uniref:Uncharacterized protein n=1 Tax=Rhamnella rubrinervis TaxID=2594499 RepID=A0A8K0H735_9ROSA|nr:hypothetical protein FNV43_RR12131 [Rhamnella rubrinervis]
MTAEVDAFESESAKLAVAEEQQCNLDLANVNGVVHGIPKDDADGSYVFVTGTDVKDDHLAADLDLSTQLNDENGEALQSQHFENNGCLGLDCETGATEDDNRINAETKAAEHLDETPVLKASGCECEPLPQHSDSKVEIEVGEAIHGLQAHEREESEISINNNFQTLPSQAETKSNSVIDANEHEESNISIPVDDNFFSSVTSQDKDKSSVPGDCGDDMEQDSRTAPCLELEADIKLTTTIDNGSVSGDIGDKIKRPTVLEIEVENVTSCPANDARSEAETCHDSIEGEEKVNNDALDIEPGVSNGVVTDGAAIQLISDSRTDVGRHLDTSVDKNGGSPASVSVDFKSESAAEKACALNGTSIPDEDAIVSESKDLHSLVVPAVDCGSDFVHVESDVKPTCQEEAGSIDEIHGDEASIPSPEVNLEGQHVGRHIDTSVDVDDGGSSVSLVVDFKPDSDVENKFASDDRNMSDDDGIVSEARDLHNPAVESGSDFVRVESGDKPTCQEAESVDGIHGDEATTSSPEDNLEGQNVARHIDTSVDKNGGSPASLSADFNPESEIEIENTYTLDSKNMSDDDAIATESRDLHNSPEDSGSDFVPVEGDVKPTCQDAESCEGIHEDEALTSSHKHNLGGLNVGQHLDSSVDNDRGSPESALDNRNMSVDDGVVSESRDLNSPHEDVEIALDSNLEFAHAESDVKQTCQEAESIDGIPRGEVSISSPENNLEGLDAGVEVMKRPFYFLIRIPRYDDENLREQIKLAQLDVEDKTKSRDAIRAKIQIKRATCKQYDGDVQSALTEERAARELFKSKRHEMDSVQFMINKVKNAISVEDIDGRIRNMEHMIEHETLPLREEKQLIREIKQLKQLREQLSSSIGKQEEIRQALDQKDQIEERLKVLRKDFDLLKDKLHKAEAVTEAARKILNDENVELKELQSHFKAADGIRQEAYIHLQNLKKQQYEKNKYFWRYKDDAKAASTLASSGDKEQLQQLCIDQVGRMMEIWNKDDDFRKEYVRYNTRSTLRRLRTLDGRSLGPDEEPPVMSHMVNDRLKKNNSVAPISTLEQEKQVAPVKAEIPDKPEAKVEGGENKKAKTKNPAKHASSGNGLTTISGLVEVEEEGEEEKKLIKEEEELARKAEELRKEEAAAKLKEQRRLEEKAKAKEALERKKRIAEKTQARAAIKAQKEAEEKQKEREKRAMKKERKKANAVEAANGVGDEGDSALAPSFNGTPKEEESETKEKPKTASKRPQKASQFTKQARANSIPLPLRNRTKRRMQPWMWVVVAVLAVFALFLVGNSNFSFEFWLHWLGF